MDEIGNQLRRVARCFLPHAVPVQCFRVPEEWLDPGKEELFFQEVNFYEIAELRMAMGRLLLERLLTEFLRGSPPLLRQWPTKDKHQFWATLWLALHFVLDRMYRE